MQPGAHDDVAPTITVPVQVCWHKFALYLDVKLREILGIRPLTCSNCIQKFRWSLLAV